LNVEPLLRSAEALLFAAIRRRLAELSLDDAVIVSADFGYIKKARICAQLLGLPLALIERRKKTLPGATSRHVIGDVSDKYAVIVDDETVTGTAFSSAATVLTDSGARGLTICCTYSALDEAAARKLRDCRARIERFITTDVIPMPETMVEELRQAFVVEILSASEVVQEIVTNISTEDEFENWLKAEGLMGFEEKIWLKSLGLQRAVG